MVEDNKEYLIDYNIISSYQLENINISFEGDLMQNNFVLSEPMIMRGIELSQINFFPIEYDEVNQTLTVIEEVEITILESEIEDDSSDQEIYSPPISKEFGKLFNNIVVNLDLGNRTTDAFPSILYGCGGSSLKNSYLQDLIQWRKEQGFTVNIVTTSEIGSNFSSISNYISDAYYDWENPPEYILLVGDTGGSYQIATTTSSGGSSDYPYTLIDGDDLLPEMIIGRISANSSSDLSNIINKTLQAHKAQ